MATTQDTQEFHQRVLVVTGAAQGIGAGFARGFARLGATVVAADRDEATLHASVEAIASDPTMTGTVIAHRADVTSQSDMFSLAEFAMSQGEVRYWINNAGIFPEAALVDITPEELESVQQVNVNGLLFGCQAAAHAMSGRPGAILNMSSVSAHKVRPGRAGYSATKAAVEHLTRFAAVEFGPANIRVNALAPGFILTEMTAWLTKDPAALAQALDRLPIQRMGQPEDLFDAAAFLLSDRASYVTGQTLGVDGGSRLV